jgi:hypothetical protein
MLAKELRVSLSLAIVMALIALSGCATPPSQPNIEQPPPPPQAAATTPAPPEPTEMPTLPPPKLEEVQQAVARIFKDAVVIDQSRKPSFLVGDFNGDLSQDLAVVVKPADGKVGDLNQEFPVWLAREPIKDVLLPKSRMLARPVAARPPVNSARAGQTVRFEQKDVLLAIIHGSGPKGWHDNEATQAHLMRDVVGDNMKVLPLKSAVKVYNGIKPFPDIYGDLIQQTLIGRAGFLHFAGGVYGWYDPRNYKAEPGPAHSGMGAK